MNFVTANDDGNLYSFDMRRLESALCVHKGHVNAVMDVAYSPTGREFVSAGYDETLRIWNFNGGHCRDIYHTRRMQRVYAARFTQDARWIVSGSADANVRIWKAEASAALKTLSRRERDADDYRKALVKKFQHMPEISRINRQRHLPKGVKAQTRKEHVMKVAQAKRDERQSRHTAHGKRHAPTAERRKHIARVDADSA
eukprot:gnl/Ergobibamus_cyprinoides/486.p2 GENE.gnl/Ergobibamus_cyprinoides/486~~gnl/Ergobibamus_cyprinoides/486.p2  ORF type:complete len:199 (-),score=33.22 gnl/Ergobibamus_cyprinoides/486:80-676(-)